MCPEFFFSRGFELGKFLCFWRFVTLGKITCNVEKGLFGKNHILDDFGAIRGS